MRTLMGWNLVLAALVYLLTLILTFVGSIVNPGDGIGWFVLPSIVLLIASVQLWRWRRDEDNWDFSGKAMKWLCFFITPWGMFLGLGVGVIVVGIMALLGAGGSSRSDPPYNSFDAQRKREEKLAVESAVNAEIRRRAQQKARSGRLVHDDWTWGKSQ